MNVRIWFESDLQDANDNNSDHWGLKRVVMDILPQKGQEIIIDDELRLYGLVESISWEVDSDYVTDGENPIYCNIVCSRVIKPIDSVNEWLEVFRNRGQENGK